jgi:hypothetical protein
LSHTTTRIFKLSHYQARLAVDQEGAEGRLKLLEAGGERGLGDAAGFRGPAEMLLTGEGKQHFELVDHGCAFTMDTGDSIPTDAGHPCCPFGIGR